MAGPWRTLFPALILLSALFLLSATAQSLLVGLTLPNAGQYTVFATAVESGIAAFQARFAEMGGIVVNGTRWNVSVIVYNDGGDTLTASLLYEHLIQQDHVHLLLSPYEPPIFLRPSAAFANALGVPLINWADADYYNHSGGAVDWIFTTRPSYFAIANECLAAASQAGARTACVSQSTKLPHLEENLPASVESYNFTILSTDTLNDTNVAAVALKWASLQPDLIIGGATPEDDALLLDTFLRNGGSQNLQVYDISLLTARPQASILFYGANNADFRDLATWEAENSLSADYWTPGMGKSDPWFYDPFFSTPAIPDGSLAFQQYYTAMFNEPPDTLQASIVHALEVAVMAFNLSQSVDPFAIRSALETMDRATILGRTKFDPVQHRMPNTYLCLQYQVTGQIGSNITLVNQNLASTPLIWPAIPPYPPCWPGECPSNTRAIILGVTIGVGGFLILAAIAVFLLVRQRYHFIFIGKDETAARDSW